MKVDIKMIKKQAQSLVEYGLILALVAVVAIGILQKLGSTITKSSDSAVTQIDMATKSYCESLSIKNVDGTDAKSCSWDDSKGCVCAD